MPIDGGRQAGQGRAGTQAHCNSLNSLNKGLFYVRLNYKRCVYLTFI